MAARIALLGWGSLLWDGGEEFEAWHEPWQKGGPSLRIEFSRISKKRGGALTLVIDPEHGQTVQVNWSLSLRQSVDDAVEDLRKREQTPNPSNIGRLGFGIDEVCKDRASLDAIRSWYAERGLTGVVWTDLRSNFEKELGEAFSVEAAIRYLKSLKGKSRSLAIEYFQRAPSFVRTPVREAVKSEILADQASQA